jgi:hypothetical protein
VAAMSHTACHDVGQWVSDNVQQQVERCVEQDCNWWCLCCNKWLCGLVWVLVVVTTWVVTTVCEVVADVIDTIVLIVKGLADIVVGIFTLDWSRIVAGLGEIVGAVVKLVVDLIPILIGTSLVGAFVEAGQAWALRRYVRQKLTEKFGTSDPAGLAAMLQAVGLTGGGGFGLRLEAMAARSQIRSDTRSGHKGTPPVLAQWVAAGLDLKSLAGFNPPLWWKRTWPELVGDGGHSMSESDLDAWIAAGGVGADLHQFSLFAMSDGDLRSRLDCADVHASELGLVFRWTVNDAVLLDRDQVLVNRGAFAQVAREAPFSRADAGTDLAAAVNDLANPLVIAGFDYLDGTGMGISCHLATCPCLEPDVSGEANFTGERSTAAHFRYRKPDEAFKFTAIHELGHTFGLCHVSGLLRIMFTNAPGQNASVWSWSSFWQYLKHGTEAGFVLDEARKVWDYIIANFDPARLQVRAF